MARSSVLQRSLRRIHAFRSLSSTELDKVVEQMEPRVYQAGQVLWRTKRPLDFWGVVEKGEIVLEYRSHGVITRYVRLAAGESIGPDRWKPKRNHILLATAFTEAQLWVIRCERLGDLPSSAKVSTPRLRPASDHSSWVWKTLLFALAALLIFTIGWPDLSRIISGAMLLEAQRQLSTSPDLKQPMMLLGVAESVDPSASFAYNQQGYWMFGAGELQKAGASFAVAVYVDSTDGASLNNQAVTFFTQGDIHQAVQVQEQAVQNDLDNALVHYNLGIMQMRLGQTSEALRQFKEAGFIQPEWALPAQQQALLYLQMRDYKQAEAAARNALRLDSKHTATYMVLAIALYEQGRDPEALDAVENALALSPDESVPNFYKALILGRMGKSEDALVILHRLFIYAQDPQDIGRIATEIQFLEDTRQFSSSPVQ